MWNYTDKVMDHFLNPRNVGEVEAPDATGEAGNLSCGDALKLTLKLNAQGRITDAKFKTFGCASAIASSSALTELIKGMTLDEAAVVTNRDIVALLGELPEEKMHCSVMGMEALQAAIAQYRGQALPGQDEDHEGRIVCHCFGVTDTKIRRLARENGLHHAEEVTNYCKAGGGCGTCLDSIQELLDGLWREDAATTTTPAATTAATPLTTVQKVLKVQEVIDKEIRPLLERDGGSMELVDVVGNRILVRFRGRCAVCPTSHVTLEHLVQAKLQEFVDGKLTVEQVK